MIFRGVLWIVLVQEALNRELHAAGFPINPEESASPGLGNT
jgi:hypothetical protein